MNPHNPILPDTNSTSAILAFVIILLIVGVVVGLVAYLLHNNRLVNQPRGVNTGSVGLARDRSKTSADEFDGQ
jgi:uncharacterized membrane-anchored protein YhcB (DUF1043 family)